MEYSTPPIVRGSIVRGPSRVRGFLFKIFSSQNFLVKCKNDDFTSLRNIIVILNRQLVA